MPLPRFEESGGAMCENGVAWGLYSFFQLKPDGMTRYEYVAKYWPREALGGAPDAEAVMIPWNLAATINCMWERRAKELLAAEAAQETTDAG